MVLPCHGLRSSETSGRVKAPALTRAPTPPRRDVNCVLFGTGLRLRSHKPASSIEDTLGQMREQSGRYIDPLLMARVLEVMLQTLRIRSTRLELQPRTEHLAQPQPASSSSIRGSGAARASPCR